MSQSPYNTKHTPGPWKVADIYQDNSPNIVGIFGPRSATSGFNGHCVAHVAHSRDAALIASAPELLEALKECLDDNLYPVSRQHLRVARAETLLRLIAKAEGSAHVS